MSSMKTALSIRFLVCLVAALLACVACASGEDDGAKPKRDSGTDANADAAKDSTVGDTGFPSGSAMYSRHDGRSDAPAHGLQAASEINSAHQRIRPPSGG